MTGTTVAKAAPTLPGLLPNVEARAIADRFRIIREGGAELLNRMPTGAERMILASRLRAIDEALAPISANKTDWDRADQVVADLLVGYGITRNDRNAAQTITAYLKHLDKMPIFAIRAACDDVKAGRVYDVDKRTGNRIALDPDYPPSTIRLRVVAQKHVDKLLDERLIFERVTRARRALPPPPSDAERARIAAGFEELKRSMAEASLETPEEAEARIERERAKRERALADGEAEIEREYARLGLEPVRLGGFLVSPSIARRHVVLRSKVADAPDDAGGLDR